MNKLQLPEYTFSLILFAVLLIILLIVFSFNQKGLNVKDKVVGKGQHGKSRFLNKVELKKAFKVYKLPSTIQDMSDVWEAGRIVHFEPKDRLIYVDTSTTHRSTQAPTRSGKTTCVMIPATQYHLMTGISSVNLDIKGEIEARTRHDAERLGFSIRKIDFINIIGGIDLMQDLNECINEYMKNGSIIAKAKAETISGELAGNIVHSRSRGNNENGFFLSASQGLIQSIILLVSMFAEKEEKHLSSVRSILQALSNDQGNSNNGETAIARLLGNFPDDFSPKKIIGAAFASTSETKDNIFSSALSDLKPFTNAIVEQLISVPHKKDLFNYNDLIDKKTILYISVPEGKSEFYALAKIVLKKIYEQCSDRALSLPGNKLPKPIFLNYDEFGNTPQVENINGQLSVGAGKGLLFDLTYQDYSQLKEIYGENITRVIENNCETNLVLGIASKDVEGAKIISDASGTQTIQSASISRGSGQQGTSQSLSMIERKLISIDEAMKIGDDGHFLMLRRKMYPFKCYLAPYYSSEWGLGDHRLYLNEVNENDLYPIHYMELDALKNKMNHYLHTHYQQGSPLGTTSITSTSPQGTSSKLDIKESPYFDNLVRVLMRASDNNLTVCELLSNNQLQELIAYWEQHFSDRISKLELINMLEQLNR